MIRQLFFVFFVCTTFISCTGSQEKSELLTLLGVDEEIVDPSDSDTENTYDAITLLKRGEAFFVKKDYIEAGAEYDRFLLLHPFHRMAAFAQFKLAMSYYHQMNTLDRDPAPMVKAKAALTKVVEQYPNSLYLEEAQNKIKELNTRQTEYEFSIGHYYYRTEAYPAAIARFNKVLNRSPDDQITEKTLYFLGLSQLYQGEFKLASSLFDQLSERFPSSKYQEDIDAKREEFKTSFQLS